MQSSHFRLVLGLCGAFILAAAASAFLTGRGEATDPTVSVSISQREILASTSDIDVAYGLAAAETAKCLSAAGLRDVAMEKDAAGKISFTWGGFDTREQAQQAGELYKGCYFAHMDDVDRSWQQTPAREAEATERGWSIMRCVESAHPDFKFGADEPTVNAQFATLDWSRDEAAQRCLTAAGTDIVKFTPLPR
ncbi:MAG: hypothetical protein ABIP13_10060 [Tepidiformaceae bacterium]